MSNKLCPIPVDVFVQCALAEEASAVVQIFLGKRDVDFNGVKQGVIGSHTAYRYYVVPLPSEAVDGKPLLIGVGWQAGMGALNTANFVGAVRPQLEEWNVQLWAMSGILAGVEGKCNFGDAVVALSGTHVMGKITADKHLLPEAVSTGIRDETLVVVKDLVQHSNRWIPYLLPFVIKDNHDRLVVFAPSASTSSASTTSSSSSAPMSNLVQLPPPMRWCILDMLHWIDCNKGHTESLKEHVENTPYAQFCEVVLKNADTYFELLSNGQLQLTEKGMTLLTGARKEAKFGVLNKKFPPARLYPLLPKAVEGAVISSDFVREDLGEQTGVVKQLKVDSAHRTLVGVEMEISPFLTALKDSSIPRLAVKGVCDFGDQWKDDNHHGSAAESAAAFLRAFLKNGGFEPRMANQSSGITQKAPAADSNSRLSTSPHQQFSASQVPVNSPSSVAGPASDVIGSDHQPANLQRYQLTVRNIGPIKDSVSVSLGSVTFFIGKSGCGKTMLCDLMMALSNFEPGRWILTQQGEGGRGIGTVVLEIGSENFTMVIDPTKDTPFWFENNKLATSSPLRMIYLNLGYVDEVRESITTALGQLWYSYENAVDDHEDQTMLAQIRELGKKWLGEYAKRIGLKALTLGAHLERVRSEIGFTDTMIIQDIQIDNSYELQISLQSDHHFRGYDMCSGGEKDLVDAFLALTVAKFQPGTIVMIDRVHWLQSERAVPWLRMISKTCDSSFRLILICNSCLSEERAQELQGRLPGLFVQICSL